MYQVNPMYQYLEETLHGNLGKFVKNGKVRNGMAKVLKATRKGLDRPVLAAAIASPEPFSTAIGAGLVGLPNRMRAKIYRDAVDAPLKSAGRGFKTLGKKIKGVFTRK